MIDKHRLLSSFRNTNNNAL